jgi:hypothetical protein
MLTMGVAIDCRNRSKVGIFVLILRALGKRPKFEIGQI